VDLILNFIYGILLGSLPPLKSRKIGKNLFNMGIGAIGENQGGIY